MYKELQDEGYTDINMIGINGFQYIDNDVGCMICNQPDNCSSCDEERVVPWVQDLDDDDNDEIWDDEDNDLLPDTTYGDVWESWEITLRDMVVLDRNGNYITRLNLTSFNPDPSALGECTDNYDTIKQLILSLY